MLAIAAVQSTTVALVSLLRTAAMASITLAPSELAVAAAMEATPIHRALVLVVVASTAMAKLQIAATHKADSHS